jgi:flagellar biosynthesis chaperone FliJ
MAPTSLTALLDLRRAAEEDAKQALAQAVAHLVHAEATQARLDALRTQAEQALVGEKRASPADASEGLARERFRQRLITRREQARAKAQQHRAGPLDQSRQAEAKAAESLRQATLELQAAQRLSQKTQAEERKQAERRNEQQEEDRQMTLRHQRKPR